MSLTRRDFLKYGAGATALVVGSKLPWFMADDAEAARAVEVLNFRITDTMKEMVTHNAINDARCYFWIYKEDHLPAECPGPIIWATQGQKIRIIITNDLDEPHSFFIPGMFNSGPIAPGQTIDRRFIARNPGSHLYYDNLNEPVNRVMGLHGAFIVMPRRKRGINRKWTPYARGKVTPNIQRLFDDLGTAAHWPGLSWEAGDAATDTPPFRQYIWLLHQASPNLFAEVGDFTPGLDYPADQFVTAFLHDPFSPIRDNRKAQYFTINGQSGHFSHNNPFICPNNRVGEPAIVRILNAGLWRHSMHLHANHFYLLTVNGEIQNNILWLDTMQIDSLGKMDWLLPYMRPPDIPNARGIGLADAPLPTASGSTWPPNEELNSFFPPLGTTAGVVPISVQMSPVCFPMHDHSEPSQTSQGGNYNLGLISGINFTGDRNTPGGVVTFPNTPTLHGPDCRPRTPNPTPLPPAGPEE